MADVLLRGVSRYLLLRGDVVLAEHEGTNAEQTRAFLPTLEAEAAKVDWDARQYRVAVVVEEFLFP